MANVQFAMSHQGVQGTIARLWLNLLPKVKCWRVAGSFPPSKGCWNSSPNVKLSRFFGKDNWWKLWLKRDPKVRLPDCMVGRPNQAMLLHPKQKTQNVLSKHEHWKKHVAMPWMMLVWICKLVTISPLNLGRLPHMGRFLRYSRVYPKMDQTWYKMVGLWTHECSSG